MSAVVTDAEPSLPSQPSSWALDFFTPKTTGVVEVDSSSFTRCWVSPMEIQMELAGQTAS